MRIFRRFNLSQKRLLRVISACFAWNINILSKVVCVTTIQYLNIRSKLWLWISEQKRLPFFRCIYVNVMKYMTVVFFCIQLFSTSVPLSPLFHFCWLSFARLQLLVTSNRFISVLFVTSKHLCLGSSNLGLFRMCVYSHI